MSAAPRSSSFRNARLSKVHVAVKQLGLADDDYRAILKRFTGKKSSGDCSIEELDRVLAEFKRLGWKAQKIDKAGKALRPSDKPHVRKVFALWRECRESGVVESGSRVALRAFVKRQTGSACEDPDWLNSVQANLVIEGLKAMQARHAKTQATAI